MIKNQISKIIVRKLNPIFLKIVNDSFIHKIKKENNSHYRILIVSNKFFNKSILDRHRMVFKILNEQLLFNIYSISLFTYSKEEWIRKKNNILFIPKNCFSKISIL